MIGVCGVAAGLVIDRDGVECDEDSMHKDGENGRKDMEHVHDAFDEQNEQGENADDNVVVGYTVFQSAGIIQYMAKRRKSYNCDQTLGVVYGL